MRRNSAQIAIETLEGRRLMDGTLPPPDGNPPPDQITGHLGGGHSALVVTIDNPDFIDNPNLRLLTPTGKIVALPARSLNGILNGIDNPDF